MTTNTKQDDAEAGGDLDAEKEIELIDELKESLRGREKDVDRAEKIIERLDGEDLHPAHTHNIRNARRKIKRVRS